jgi:hypothetical protein
MGQMVRPRCKQRVRAQRTCRDWDACFAAHCAGNRDGIRPARQLVACSMFVEDGSKPTGKGVVEAVFVRHTVKLCTKLEMGCGTLPRCWVLWHCFPSAPRAISTDRWIFSTQDIPSFSKTTNGHDRSNGKPGNHHNKVSGIRPA